MASLYLLLPVALIFVGVAIALFIWAVKTRQFEDLEKEGARILFEQREVAPRSTDSTNTKTPTSSTDLNPQTTATDSSPTQPVRSKKSGVKLEGPASIQTDELK